MAKLAKIGHLELVVTAFRGEEKKRPKRLKRREKLFREEKEEKNKKIKISLLLLCWLLNRNFVHNIK